MKITEDNLFGLLTLLGLFLFAAAVHFGVERWIGKKQKDHQQ